MIYHFVNIYWFQVLSCSISKESIVDVEANVSLVQGGVAGCTQGDVELLASEIWVVSIAAPQLPLQIEDASRPEKTEVNYCLKCMQPNYHILFPG